MEKIVERGLLFDIYGELLTTHQQNVYRELIESDLSLAELSEEFGITRQGAHDLIKRCDAALEDYEKKLGLMKKFLRMRNIVSETKILIEGQLENIPEDTCKQIKDLLGRLEKEI